MCIVTSMMSICFCLRSVCAIFVWLRIIITQSDDDFTVNNLIQ